VKARSFWPLAVCYVALRILLTLVIAALVVLLARLAGLDMPVLVAAMLAVIVQLPLAWLMLGGMRRRLTAQLAASAGERRRLRGELRAALSGERTSSGEHATAGEQAASADEAVSADGAAPSDEAAPSDGAASSDDPASADEPVVPAPDQATRR
jgi:hypothetical protein